MSNASYLAVSDIQTTWCPDLDLSSLSTATISGMIQAASRTVDSFTSQPSGWDYEPVVEVHDSDRSAHTDPDGNLVINLRKRPLTDLASVTDIRITLAPYFTDLVLTDQNQGLQYLYHVPDPGWNLIYPNSALITVGTLLGAVRLGSLRSYRYMVSISYSGGYRTIPYDIQYATSLLFRSIYAKRYNPSAAFETKEGQISATFGIRSMRGAPSNYSPLEHEARTILQPYVRV